MKYKTPPGIPALLLAALGIVAPVFSAGADMTRADFAKAMGTLKPGMAAAQVEKALGKPDDIVTEYDPGANFSRTSEIWCYGTDGHLSFPTLGCVFMKQGKVQTLCGNEGTPPDPHTFEETELRTLLRLMDRCENNNPLDLIQIVNTLQPLGKEKALAAIGEYARVATYYVDHPYNNGAFLVLRLLFEVPDDPGYMPRMLVGGPDPTEPKEPKILPRFPLVVIDDIPLNLVYGYQLDGEAQPVEDHIEYFRKNGKLREHPLHPTDDPLSVLAKIQGTQQWLYGGKPGSDEYDRGLEYLANQLLDLVGPVYWIEPDFRGQRISGEHFDGQYWERITKVFSELHVKWDAKQNIYTFADGTALPEIKKPVYRRQIWYLPSMEQDARLVLERMDAKTVHVMLWDFGDRGLPVEKTTIRIYRPSNKEHPLTQLVVSPGDNKTFINFIDLEAGGIIQAEAVSSRKTEASPVFTP